MQTSTLKTYAADATVGLTKLLDNADVKLLATAIVTGTARYYWFKRHLRRALVAVAKVRDNEDLGRQDVAALAGAVSGLGYHLAGAWYTGRREAHDVLTARDRLQASSRASAS